MAKTALPDTAPADDLGKAYHALIEASQNYRLKSEEAQRATRESWDARRAVETAQEAFDKAVDKVRAQSPFAKDWNKPRIKE